MRYLVVRWMMIGAVLGGLLGGCGRLDSSDVGLVSDSLYGAVPGSYLIVDLNAGEPVMELKVCVAAVRLYNEQYQDLLQRRIEDAKREGLDTQPILEKYEFRPGLLDLTGPTGVDWGRFPLPGTDPVAKIRVKIRRDPELCGVDYSLRFNGRETDRDIELKFRFDPPVSLLSPTGGLDLKLHLSEVIAPLRLAAQASQLDTDTAEAIKQTCESVEGKADIR